MVESGHWRQGGAQTANLVAPAGCVAFSVTFRFELIHHSWPLLDEEKVKICAMGKV
jgi:hypothetical protein